MKTFTYQIFATVADLGSFRKAAEELNITPSAVSHAISHLETQLGIPLLIRNRSEMQVTKNGQILLPAVERLLNEERQLLSTAAKLQGLQGGQIRIGAISSVCIAWLPTIIQRFAKKYPAVEINLIQGSFAEIEQALVLGKIDLGFSALPTVDRLDALPLVDDEIKCLTPANFRPQNGESISQADLANKHFILQRSDYDSDTKVALDELQVKPQAINYSIDDQSILAMVEAGLGWGVLPDLALTRLTGEIEAYPFATPYYRHLGLVTNPSSEKDPFVKAMKNEILAYLDETKTTEQA
ncbi:LysR family transcriptional regulator [Fructobacillus ficulneus]|uniref:LysR substrate binding domain protein n=1 Tax=Fructobacillus ficulneus TaxID=157463 RepID=A0A0K8MII0_9LACO|nr:LysR family transcriptional regulator [Fructobacillus ficulneus]GAP00263.1 LysR substrate binding domain protein [Fructobacillus ficulneus]